MPEAVLASASDLLAGYHDAEVLATWWGRHFGPSADG